MENNILEIIETRRSIRKYTNENISDEKIKKILKTAMYAPSAINGQCWEFIVIKDMDIKKKLANYNPAVKVAKDAAIAIIVCGNMKRTKMKIYWELDCSAATQNLMLAAHVLGYGSVWHGVYPNQELSSQLSKMFNLPDHIIPFAVVPIGKPAEIKPKPERYHEEYIHFDKWE